MPRRWKDEAEFKPWERQRIRGLKSLGIAAALGLAAYALPYGSWTWALAGLGVVAFSIGAGALRQAANRAFGKSFEAVWTTAALEGLGDDVDVRANVRVPGAGDADLIVRRCEDGLRLIVEIKAFVVWRASFFGLFPGEREVKAFAQAARLQELTHCETAIVWLPQGRPSFWQWLFPPKRNGVRVVFGDLGALRGAIKRIPQKQ